MTYNHILHLLNESGQRSRSHKTYLFVLRKEVTHSRNYVNSRIMKILYRARITVCGKDIGNKSNYTGNGSITKSRDSLHLSNGSHWRDWYCINFQEPSYYLPTATCGLRCTTLMRTFLTVAGLEWNTLWVHVLYDISDENNELYCLELTQC